MAWKESPGPDGNIRDSIPRHISGWELAFSMSKRSSCCLPSWIEEAGEQKISSPRLPCSQASEASKGSPISRELVLRKGKWLSTRDWPADEQGLLILGPGSPGAQACSVASSALLRFCKYSWCYQSYPRKFEQTQGDSRGQRTDMLQSTGLQRIGKT